MGKKEWCNILERAFQSEVIKEIKERLVGAIVLKNDPNYLQGVPDLIILYSDRWAALEVKKTKEARLQPNQQYYVLLMNSMSYASLIHPENKKEVLDELEQALRI